MEKATSSIMYTSTNKNTKLEYIISSNAVKENIIVSKCPSNETEYAFKISVKHSVNTINYGNGDTISYSYSNGNITSTSLSGTIAYSYSYDPSGKLSSVTDSNSGYITTFNDNGYEIRSVDNVLVYSYNVNEDENDVESIFGRAVTRSSSTSTYDNLTSVTTQAQTLSTPSGDFSFTNSKDYFERTTKKSVSYPKDATTDVVISTYITYKQLSNGNTTMLPESFDSVPQWVSEGNVLLDCAGASLNYEYDDRANITGIYSNMDENNNPIYLYLYTYDEAGQVVREDSRPKNCSYVYVYDIGGNLVSRKTYAFSTGTLGTVTDTINYSYGNALWKDQLTAYAGNTISYDNIGNPLSYYGKSISSNNVSGTLEWEGRRLISFTDTDGTKYVYKYNNDGLRTKKTTYDMSGNITQTVEYIWRDNKLLSTKSLSSSSSEPLIINYLYDEMGEVIGFEGNAVAPVLYLKNAQGDVISLLNAGTGTSYVNYNYDAWGNATMSTTATDLGGIIAAIFLAAMNGITYRGYYCDNDTGLYYLQSRYYSSSWGRFLNADSSCNTDSHVLASNMYAYCKNNPVNAIDPRGSISKFPILTFIWNYVGLGSWDERYDDPDSLTSKGFLGFVNAGNSVAEMLFRPWATVIKGWQSNLGYTDLYDLAAPLMGCFIYSIKSQFSYGGDDWRIELWMGRYGVALGAEIGIYKNYVTQIPLIKIPISISGWYECSTDDRFSMFYVLFKLRKTGGLTCVADPIVVRASKSHWWLCGFQLNLLDLEVELNGQWFKPTNLMMISFISFKDKEMAKLFKAELDSFKVSIFSIGQTPKPLTWSPLIFGKQNVWVYWCTERIADVGVPVPSIGGLLYRTLITFH